MRLIDADAFNSWLEGYAREYVLGKRKISITNILEHVRDMSTIQTECKRGRWLEKKVVHAINDERIAEWQSCKCSECGRYDTRPYMYYFDEPNFCSWCGAEMQEEES